MKPIIFIIIGAALGATFGYFGKCSTGTCPFTSTWWGGAIFGALFGLLLSNFFAGMPKTPEDINNVIDITDAAEFDAKIAAARDKEVLADFYLKTCPPCRKLMPELYELARSHPDDLIILKVNATKNRELSARYGIQAVPALFHIKSGKVISKSQGYQPAAALEKFIFGK